MKNKVLFDGKHECLDTSFSSEFDISDEHMIVSSSLPYAQAYGGSITEEFLNKILKNENFIEDRDKALSLNFHPIVDTKVTMLMPGMYPSIPGWHCDDWIRNENGQPQIGYEKQAHEIWHYTVSIGNADSKTSFLDSQEIDVDSLNVWHSVDKAMSGKEGTTYPMGSLVRFSGDCIHTATPCKNTGWRFWMRISFSKKKPLNKMRTQVQVYSTINGW